MKTKRGSILKQYFNSQYLETIDDLKKGKLCILTK
jgi:hypothetical protein